MNFKLIFACILVSASAFAANIDSNPQEKIVAYLNAHGVMKTDGLFQWTSVDGAVSITSWNAPVAMPTDADLPTDGDLVGIRIAKDLEANGARYAYQDAFLMLCDAISGTNTHAKLAFEEIPVYLKPMRSANRDQFDVVKDAFSTINMALVEKAGTKWWQSCTWNENLIVISNATVILNALTNP